MKKLLALLLIMTVGMTYTIDTFNDSSYSSSFAFAGAGSNKSMGITVPVNVDFVGATLNITGSGLWQWETPYTNVSNSASSVEMMPRIAVDSSGNMHAVFITNSTDANFDVAYWNSTLSPGSFVTFSAEGASGYWDGFPDLAIDSNDVVHVVWSGNVSGGSSAEIYYLNSSNWGAVPTMVSYVNEYASENPVIAIDSNGVKHVAWHEYDNSALTQIWYANSSSGYSETQITYKDTRSAYTPDIAVDSNNAVHIVYIDPELEETAEGSGGSLHLASPCPTPQRGVYYRNSSDGFAAEYTIDAGASIPYCNSKNPKIAVDQNDFIHVVWWADYDARHICYTNSSDLLCLAYVMYPDIAVDSDGIVHIIALNATTNDYIYLNSTEWASETLTTVDPAFDNIAFLFPVGPSIAASDFGVYAAWDADLGDGGEIIYSKIGVAPFSPTVDIDSVNAFSFTGPYKSASNVTSILSFLESAISSCTPSGGMCNLTLDVSSGSAGLMNLNNLNLTYGTKLNQSDIDWLAFTLDDYSTLVNETVITQDSDVYVWDLWNEAGPSLVAKIPMDFSSVPDYSTWNAESNIINEVNGRQYSFAFPLNESGYGNTGNKTLYLRVGTNASAKGVCFVDSPNVQYTVLSEISDISTCAAAEGNYSRMFEKVNINETWYYEIPNVVNSGAVEIVGDFPEFSAISVDPSTPNQFTTSIVFNVDVEYSGTLDGVYLVGNGSLGTHEMTCTESAGVFSCSYDVGSLTAGDYSYYFRAVVGGSDSFETTPKTLTVSTASSAGVVTSAPGFGLELAVLLFVITALVMVFKEN